LQQKQIPKFKYINSKGPNSCPRLSIVKAALKIKPLPKPKQLPKAFNRQNREPEA
jgi:hypothetical protein